LNPKENKSWMPRLSKKELNKRAKEDENKSWHKLQKNRSMKKRKMWNKMRKTSNNN
jgi:hypothetical protein